MSDEPKLSLKERLHQSRRLIEQQEVTIKELRREINSLTWRNQNLRDELTKASAPATPTGDKFTAPVPRLADGMKGVEQARSVLADVTEHIGQALQERDALLEYILEKAPDAPEKKQRERVHDVEDTGRSVIRRLRIGKKDKSYICEKCGQPSAKHCSAHLFVGLYKDGRPGEIFLVLGREHRFSITGGGYHGLAKMASLALQHGAKPESIIRQLRHQNDSSGGKPWGPDGPIKDARGVASLVDYVGVVLEELFPPPPKTD